MPASITTNGPMLVGSVRQGALVNLGSPILTQIGTINVSGASVVDLTFYLPANAKITGIVFDVTTVFNAGTSSTFSAGVSTGATTYVSGVDGKTATGRIAATYTGAQLAAMNNITTNTTLVVTQTPVGTTATTGVCQVRVDYIQR